MARQSKHVSLSKVATRGIVVEIGCLALFLCGGSGGRCWRHRLPPHRSSAQSWQLRRSAARLALGSGLSKPFTADLDVRLIKPKGITLPLVNDFDTTRYAVPNEASLVLHARVHRPPPVRVISPSHTPVVIPRTVYNESL